MRAKITILLLFFACSVYSQIGVQAHWENLNRTGVNTTQFKGYTIGINYWFRLEKKRLEFQPMIGYQSLDQVNNDQVNINFPSVIFEFQTNFYPLDWFNDCKCPTFGKTNDFIKKGFFLTAAPFAAFDLSDEREEGSNSLMWGIKAGAGLDIGITQFLTITPVARLALSPSHYLGLPEFQKQTLFGYNLGLTATLRFDEKNYAF